MGSIKGKHAGIAPTSDCLAKLTRSCEGDGESERVVRAAHLTYRSPSDTWEDGIAQEGKNGSSRNPIIQLAFKHRWAFLSLQICLAETILVNVVVVYRWVKCNKNLTILSVLSHLHWVGLPVTLGLFLPGYAIYQSIRS